LKRWSCWFARLRSFAQSDIHRRNGERSRSVSDMYSWDCVVDPSPRLLARRVPGRPTDLDKDDIRTCSGSPSQHRVIRVRRKQQFSILSNLRSDAVTETLVYVFWRVLNTEIKWRPRRDLNTV
jgi:hypothetical protein